MGFISEIFKVFSKSMEEYNRPALEENYGGVPLSELQQLATRIRSGSVWINGPYLEFRCNTTRGRPGHTFQFRIDHNKLSKMTFQYYPGQRYFPEDDFMERANEQFTFYDQQ